MADIVLIGDDGSEIVLSPAPIANLRLEAMSGPSIQLEGALAGP
jgi:hypothetical protein